MRKEYHMVPSLGKGQGGEEQVTVSLPLPLAEVMAGVEGVVEEMAAAVGVLLMEAAMEAEVARLVGPRHQRRQGRRAWRWGRQKGSVVFAGRRVRVKRPRARGAGGEIPLGTYQRFQEDGSLQRAVARRLVLGVSARHYQGVLEDFCRGYGIKKSSVSRRWVKATAQALQELCERPLGDRQWVVIIIDGIDFEGRLLVVALGIDKDGNKRALGIWQGATENAVVVTALLEDLVRRGLDPQGRYLFLLDGSKALLAGVKRVFGEDTEVQRCQLHKRRNVKEHLPPEHQGAIEARLRAAYGMATYAEARASLERTIEYLERLNPSAARSLGEGLEETLTLHRLGVPEALRRSLCSTNLLESGLSMVSDFTGRVKRWRGGEQVQRWAAAALLEGERRWKRVRGYKYLPLLEAALQRVDKIEQVA